LPQKQRKEAAMGKLKIGNCPRCNKGEVFIDRDQYGWFECCLQCGYTRDLPDLVEVKSGKHPKNAEYAKTGKKEHPLVVEKKASKRL
jgi:hypothetical protein